MIDFKKNKHFHFIGIGGIGMSGLAEILLNRGCKVSGSDIKPSEITARLQSKGAEIFTSHEAENVKDCDMVVYTAAVSNENPELKQAEISGIPVCSRAELLGDLMEDNPYSIAISGTHGKTTTTSMVSLILQNSGKDPTILVGGDLPEIGGNVKVGNGDFFVTEACEYRDSFLSMKPNVEIILNIDSDHLDYFKDINHIASSFTRFASLVPDDGLVVAYTPNAFVAGAVKSLGCKVVTFGASASCDYSADDIVFDNNGHPGFTVIHNGEKLGRIQLAIPGEHNVLNAVAAFACTHSLGAPVDKIIQTLEAYEGTHRRFDSIGETKNGAKIIDDYAHHPTEINATLKAAANIRHDKIWCIFQPHTYTRTLALFDEFAGAFNYADVIILTEIYAAREKNIYKVSSRDLVPKMMEIYRDKEIQYIESFEEISNYVGANAGSDDLVITMGAGDVYKVGDLLKK